MTKLNKDQIRVEFIKLVSDENENQISSSNNRNSCVLLQSNALANNDFSYKKFADDKDKVGISLKDLNALGNSGDLSSFGILKIIKIVGKQQGIVPLFQS